jgi:hypothetical protein
VPLRITGDEAAIRWGYHRAAALRAWTVAQGDGSCVLTATIQTADHYRLSQQPLVFEVQRPASVWRWPILELQVSGVSLTATLGPKE